MEFPTTAEAIYLTSLTVALVVIEKVITQRLLNRQRREMKGLMQEWQGLVALLKVLRQQREAAERQVAELQLRKTRIELQLQEQILSLQDRETRQLAMAVELDNLLNEP
ncbi:MAG: hypothetical protein FJY95_08690 [Candidatus Handelsmanbacteria bacterium]|nr:hypothetical protein [Candidatus Handelsmanbacteria bacterium]